MRKLAVLGTFVVVAAGGGLLLAGRATRAQQASPSVPDSVAAVALAAGDTASLPGPRQPIFFRHDIHAGQYKIDCQYCHSSVTVSSEPGIPSVQTCMGCHTAIAGTDSSARREIRKLRTFWNNREQPDSAKLEWTRIHTLARHVRFPHMLHVKAMGSQGLRDLPRRRRPHAPGL